MVNTNYTKEMLREIAIMGACTAVFYVYVSIFDEGPQTPELGEVDGNPSESLEISDDWKSVSTSLKRRIDGWKLTFGNVVDHIENLRTDAELERERIDHEIASLRDENAALRTMVLEIRSLVDNGFIQV